MQPTCVLPAVLSTAILKYSCKERKLSVLPHRIDFAAAFTQMNQYSTIINHLSLNGVVNKITIPTGSNPHILLAPNKVNFINLTSTQLNNLPSQESIIFDNKPTTTQPLIINISITNDFNWNTPNIGGIGDTESQYIIWNFYTTNSSLSLSGNNAIYGIILAPTASVSKSSSSNLSGQIIAKSASLIQGYINYQPFSAQIADIFPSNIALPVESIELTVQLQNNTIALTWLAYNELNSNVYQVESSIDGRNCTTGKSIESVGSGTNKYKTSVDTQTFNSISVYFRIKALDKNGKIYYSKVAMINLTAVVSVQTWPNPVSEHLNISIQASTKQTMSLQL